MSDKNQGSRVLKLNSLDENASILMSKSERERKDQETAMRLEVEPWRGQVRVYAGIMRAHSIQTCTHIVGNSVLGSPVPGMGKLIHPRSDMTPLCMLCNSHCIGTSPFDSLSAHLCSAGGDIAGHARAI